MIDVKEKKEKILSFLETNGPSLPVRISKAIEMEPVFTSAILSELLNDKKIKTSNLRVGSSPLYLLLNQEKNLEEHSDNLKHIEKEAYLKLKESRLLIDDDEEPAIRVALRSIKDFAKSFTYKDKLMWKYAFTPNSEIEEMLKPKQEKEEKQNKEETKNRPEEISETKSRQTKSEVKKSLEPIFITKENDQENDFLDELKVFLKKRDIEFLDQIQSDKKEVVGKVSIKTSLGKINFLLIAKNKKGVTKEELSSAIQRAGYSKMPCLYVIRKEPLRSVTTFLEEYSNILKLLVF